MVDRVAGWYAGSVIGIGQRACGLRGEDGSLWIVDVLVFAWFWDVGWGLL